MGALLGIALTCGLGAAYAGYRWYDCRAVLAEVRAQLQGMCVRAQALHEENIELKRQIGVLQGGHPPAMAQALLNAPTIFEQARRQAAILERHEAMRTRESTPAAPPPPHVFDGGYVPPP